MDYWMGSIEDFINEMNINWWVKEKRKIVSTTYSYINLFAKLVM